MCLLDLLIRNVKYLINKRKQMNTIVLKSFGKAYCHGCPKIMCISKCSSRVNYLNFHKIEINYQHWLKCHLCVNMLAVETNTKRTRTQHLNEPIQSS